MRATQASGALAVLAAASSLCGCARSADSNDTATAQSAVISCVGGPCALGSYQADSFFSDANHFDVPSAYLTLRYPDVSGDLRPDVCGRNQDGVWCAIDNGNSLFATATNWNNLFTDTNGFNQPQYYTTIQFPDIDGDHKADLCGRGAGGILCGFSNGTSGFGSLTLWNTLFTDANGFNQPQYYTTIQFPDVTGEGKADFCGRGIGGVLCGVSNGTSNFDTALGVWSSFYSNANHWDAGPQYYSTIRFPDLDGNGKADICGRGPDASGTVRMWCALSNGSTGFGAVTSWNSTFGDSSWDVQKYYSTIQFADVNGDGKDDLCGRGPGGGPGTTVGIWCALSNGANGFGTPTLWNASIGSPAWDAPEYYSTIHFAKGMVCGRGGDGMYCAYSNGKSFPNELRESGREDDPDGWTLPQYYRTIAISSDFKLLSRSGIGVFTMPASYDVVTLSTPSDVLNRRTELINKIWGRSTIDTTQGVDSDTPLNITTLGSFPLPAGTVVRRYQINIPNAGGGSVIGLADHFVPPGNPSRLMIINPGHACTYDALPFQDAQTVVALLNEGYGVLATYMPAANPLDCKQFAVHGPLFSGSGRPAGNGNPLIYFLDPVRRGLNYAFAHFPYTRADMTGLSGGGWTTTVYAALDTRIRTSIPVAGTEPAYMRQWTLLGDPLQDDPESAPELIAGNDFYNFKSGNKLIVTNLKDLYIMGGYGVGRRQVQVLNRGDDCCFNPGTYTGLILPWDLSVRDYEAEVRSRLSSIGGAFRVEINESNDSCTVAGTCATGTPGGHEFSKNTQVNIILSELNGSHPFLAAPATTFGFARGTNGHLLQNSSGTTTWVDTGLAMTGTPAVVKGAVNPFDAFYRDPQDNLVHARFNGTSWQALTDITGRIITDPVAVSWGSGRIDVVALTTDYVLHHWALSGGVWSTEIITSGTLGVGQPALTTWGTNRLDVFFRGIDAKLYHASTSTGAGPWSAVDTVSGGLPSQVIRSFPGATSFSGSPGTLLAYAVGNNNQLYEMSKVNNGAWTTTNISLSSSTGSTPVFGSPAPFRNSGGTRTVYARVGTSQHAATYTLAPGAGTWTFTDRQNPGRSYVGSPVANDLGGFLIDELQSGQLVPAAGGSATALGGYLDR